MLDGRTLVTGRFLAVRGSTWVMPSLVTAKLSGQGRCSIHTPDVVLAPVVDDDRRFVPAEEIGWVGSDGTMNVMMSGAV